MPRKVILYSERRTSSADSTNIGVKSWVEGMCPVAEAAFTVVFKSLLPGCDL
jgi:hypothetical protein